MYLLCKFSIGAEKFLFLKPKLFLVESKNERQDSEYRLVNRNSFESISYDLHIIYDAIKMMQIKSRSTLGVPGLRSTVQIWVSMCFLTLLKM